MIKKLSITIFIFISFFILFINYGIYATFEEEYVIGESENYTEVEEIEPQICKYNKSTNETTIIETDDIQNVLNSKLVYSKTRISDVPTYRNNLFNNTRAGYQFYLANTGLDPYKYVCRIITSDYEYGSGYLVGPNLLLTCAHCVFPDRKIHRNNLKGGNAILDMIVEWIRI